MHPVSIASLALALSLPSLAAAQVAGTDIDTLRQEIAAIRNIYEARLQALELRLKAAEARTAVAPVLAVAPPAAPAASAASASPAAPGG
ncbi:MAG: hypothetical protein Q8L49_14885, partial [Burkholderiaceae bacterium]|nr:hypothetical protein [Burkholderiaceae bacterium]